MSPADERAKMRAEILTLTKRIREVWYGYGGLTAPDREDRTIRYVAAVFEKLVALDELAEKSATGPAVYQG